MNFATKTISSGDCISQLTSKNASIRPEKLLDVLAFNKTGGVLYLMYFDNVAAVPVNGTAPSFGINIAVQPSLGGTLGRPLDIMGGIFVWSTTQMTLTAVVANSGFITVILKG